eukprot:gnl/TRDRNA2_/TRDRNA2_173341_c0_seq2.p1 gnl/TRDRNA2_/TRDRNA2_173341_c0~~gnl/TRDRNA2_/TRDRNA2_173341_c0_seq2.p1  ORF type:complete len:425 (-),score=54.77 gnl/TRDRNA2_/TRDRNA2_173341_c0_seq2:122-1396(-)
MGVLPVPQWKPRPHRVQPPHLRNIAVSRLRSSFNVLRASYDRDVLYEALEQIDYPSRLEVFNEAKRMAEEFEVFLLPYGFSFRQKGGLWSPYVEYVSDVDLMFFPDEEMSLFWKDHNRSVVSRDVAKKFVSAGQSLFESRLSSWIKVVSASKGNTFLGRYREVEGTWEELIEPDTVKLELVGVYALESAPGWRVPMDVTLTTREESLPRSVRAQQIVHSLEAGDFAKAAQRVRPLIFNKTSKWTFAQAVNHEIGQLRFVVRQLQVVQTMQPEAALEYVRSRLHLPVDEQADIVGWRQAAIYAMQEKAYAVITDFQDMLMDDIRGRRFTEARESFKAGMIVGKETLYERAAERAKADIVIDDRQDRSPVESHEDEDREPALLLAQEYGLSDMLGHGSDLRSQQFLAFGLFALVIILLLRKLALKI